ncbi:MAG TPA: response regulator [Mucilaginibacter sp.]|jgi:DNA-binding NarL/FixJ family response regulator|nr:response regulator [Mucilaginibacter sp.]
MKKINCIIADDEALAREVIESYVLKIEQLHLVAVCSNGIEVFNALKTKSVDILLLDIQMPHLNIQQ